MELSDYIKQALLNLEKKINRANIKEKDYKFNNRILKELTIQCNQDIGSDEFKDFLHLYYKNCNEKIGCTEIENDMDYHVETEQHDYCHSSSWITNIKNNYIYSYFEIMTKDEITYRHLILEAIDIGSLKKDEYGLDIIFNFEKLLRKQKMLDLKIEGISIEDWNIKAQNENR